MNDDVGPLQMEAGLSAGPGRFQTLARNRGHRHRVSGPTTATGNACPLRSRETARPTGDPRRTIDRTVSWLTPKSADSDRRLLLVARARINESWSGVSLRPLAVATGSADRYGASGLATGG